MQFADSHYLFLLWLVPIAFFLNLLVYKKISKKLKKINASRLSVLMSGRIISQAKWLKAFLFSLGLGCIIVSLARPRWGFEWKDVPRGGVDIMAVVDLSQSMLASDISPNRLERAKREVIDLLNMLEGDRIGIVAFAGVPFVQCPLTVDYRLASLFISQLNVEMMPVQGTGIGDAVRMAVDHLEKFSSKDSQAKSIILITDGEDHGTEPLQAASFAKEKSVKIFAIGVGAQEGAPIPLTGGGFKKDKAGNMIVSHLDEKTLQTMALATEGMYVRSTTGEMDLEHVYKKGIRGSVQDDSFGEARQKVWYERFQIFILWALFFLLSEFFIREYKPFKKPKKNRQLFEKQGGVAGKQGGVIGETAQLVPLYKFERNQLRSFLSNSLPCFSFFGRSNYLFLFFLFQGASLRADSLSDAKKLYEEKKYEEAEKKYEEAEKDDPSNLQHTYNKAVAAFQAMDYDKAINGFIRGAQSDNKDLAAKSYFNLGNSLVAKGKFEESLKAYDQVLKISPEDKDTKENMAWVKTKIEEQKKQKNDQNKDDKKDQDKENKEEKKDQDKEKSDKKEDEKKSDNKNDTKDQDKEKSDKKEDEKKSDNKNDKKDQSSSPEKDKKEDKGQDKKDQKEDAKEEKAAQDKKEDSASAENAQKSKNPYENKEVKDLNKEQAEKLLRTIEEDQAVYYGVPPKVKRSTPKPEQDW